jgi:HNH endonuclease
MWSACDETKRRGNMTAEGEGEREREEEVVDLVPGLPLEEIEALCLSARRKADVGNRMLAFYLHDLAERGLYRKAGYATAVAFARARLSISERQAQMLLFAGRELLSLRKIDGAFGAGWLSWSQVKLLLRVASVEHEGAWLGVALRGSCRDLEARVKRSKKGERPKEKGFALSPARFQVTARLDALSAEIWETAKATERARSGRPVSDEEMARLGAEAVLLAEERDSEEERGRKADFRAIVSVQVLRRGDGSYEALLGTADEPVALERGVAEAIACDAGCCVPRRERGGGARRRRARGEGGGDGGRCAPVDRDRATPDWMRKRVLARDGYRCVVCRGRWRLSAHHIVFLEDGGPTVEWNLATCCVACHSNVHDGYLGIEGKAPGELRISDAAGRALHAPGEPIPGPALRVVEAEIRRAKLAREAEEALATTSGDAAGAGASAMTAPREDPAGAGCGEGHEGDEFCHGLTRRTRVREEERETKTAEPGMEAEPDGAIEGDALCLDGRWTRAR